MQEENISRAIIVVQQGMTPSAKQVDVYCVNMWVVMFTFCVQSFYFLCQKNESCSDSFLKIN